MIGLSQFLIKEDSFFSDKVPFLLDMMVTFLMMQKFQEKTERKKRTRENRYLEDLLKFEYIAIIL